MAGNPFAHDCRLRQREPWDTEEICPANRGVRATLIDGLAGRSLQDLANGPCMNALDIFLPEGKLSMADTLKREQAALRDANSQP